MGTCLILKSQSIYIYTYYNDCHKFPLIPVGWHIYFVVKDHLRLSFSDVAMVTQYDGWLVIMSTRLD